MRGSNKKKKNKKKKKKDDRAGSDSLMLSEWSVKTGLKCSGVMKD